VPDVPDQESVYEVVCPHCGKGFEAQPLSGGAERYQGFKCPHCRLFVAYDRVEELEQVDSSSA
jgi:predicted RNA-binding Zn-ribbon protein involved in translation (DUF1610 family)